MYGPDLRHFWNFYRKDKNDTGRHAIMVHFRRDSLGESMLSQFEMADLRRLLENAGRGIAFSPETGEKAEEPMRRMLSDTGMKKMVSFFRLLEILCSAPKFKILSGENLEGVREITDSRLAEVCSFIRENFYRPIPVKEIAVVAKMSPHSFSRFFSRSTGSGFVNYVNQVRTNKACYLLRETDHQINEIVYECGFATISNFNKQFRKHAGMSARDYRAQYRT
jgi:AraC-like DNA-binding protein